MNGGPVFPGTILGYFGLIKHFLAEFLQFFFTILYTILVKTQPKIFSCFFCFVFFFNICLCALLFVCALWSHAGKRLTSWLSFVVSNCEFVTFSLVSWPRCGTLLYRFLIFAPLVTYISEKKSAADPVCISRL